MSIEKKKLSNEELRDVNGGTCYSSKTYEGLGLFAPWNTYTKFWHHPVIVTAGNSCPHWIKSDRAIVQHTCNDCIFMLPKGITMYCGRRSYENPNGEKKY